MCRNFEGRTKLAAAIVAAPVLPMEDKKLFFCSELVMLNPVSSLEMRFFTFLRGATEEDLEMAFDLTPPHSKAEMC